MAFNEIGHTDSVGDAQVQGVQDERDTKHHQSVRLERAEACGTAGLAFETDLLCAWLVTASWYANWVENVSSVIIARTANIPCPEVDPSAPAATLRAECEKRLHDLRATAQGAWQVQACSNTEQCEGLFGAAQLKVTVSQAAVELWFDPRVLDRALAHEILDTLRVIAGALQAHPRATLRALAERARPVQSNSELTGKLQGVILEDVLDALNAHVAQDPKQVAIREADMSLDYGQLSTLVKALATALEHDGVKAGSRVALCMPRSSDFIIAALALLSLQAIYIPIDLELPAERRRLMIEDAQVEWIIDHDGTRRKLRPSAHINTGCGYVLFTSGTTGRPKGVMVSRAALSYYASVARHTFNLSRHSRVLQFATVSFDASVEEIYPCLMAGGTVVIRDSSVDLRPAPFLAFLEQQHITFLDLPTGYWRELSTACSAQNLRFPPSVALVVVGGEALYQSDIHAWFRLPAPRPELINSYGPTETTVVTTLQRVRLPADSDAAKNDISIGYPIAGSRIVLLDRFDQPAPLGGLGQICISSPGLAAGYLDSPEMTDVKFFVQLESDRSQRRYYKSGDLGRIDRDGALEYHGRMDNVVKRQGFRISLGEIESIIRTLPEVSDCCVFMSEAGGKGKLLCAVQLIPGVQATQHELRQELSMDLPSYMVPNSFVVLDELPRNLAGKIDFNKVQAFASNVTDLNDSDLPPHSELLAGIRSILAGRMLDWDLSLTENGADSLEIVRLSVLLEQHSGQPWPMSALYACSSLRTLLNGFADATPAQPEALPFNDWRHAELDRLKGLIQRERTPSSCTGDGILVTGATGLLGRHLVKDLLRRTARPIYCLIRNPTGESVESAQQRLVQTLGLITQDLRRLNILVGDLKFKDFGLESPGLRTLGHSISDIVHCAADTNMLSPYSGLLTTNVLGSVNLINLALATGAHFHFVSSLALFDSKPALPNVSPASKIAEVGDVASGYLQGKWMIEMLLETLRDTGLKATTYRCGRLWGSVDRPDQASNDYVFQFLSVCQRLGQFPIMPMQLEVSPADCIAHQLASAVIATASHCADAHSTYHLCSSKSHAMDEIYQAMQHLLPDLALADSAAWFGALSAYVLANPQDVVAMRVFAVVKSLSLSDCIDDLVIGETNASRQWWPQGLPPGLSPAQIAHTVVVGAAPLVHTQRLVHG